MWLRRYGEPTNLIGGINGQHFYLGCETMTYYLGLSQIKVKASLSLSKVKLRLDSGNENMERGRKPLAHQ